MKGTVNISSKAIFVVLGIIVVVASGYFTVKIIFPDPSVVGKTFVSIPTKSYHKIESMSFTKNGIMLEAEYSQTTEKWTDGPVSGKYEISDGLMILTALEGLYTKSVPMQWISKDKYSLVHDSDTIVYVLKGTEEDPSTLNFKSILGENYVVSICNSDSCQYYEQCFEKGGGYSSGHYLADLKKWTPSAVGLKYGLSSEGGIGIMSPEGAVLQESRIKWITKDSYCIKVKAKEIFGDSKSYIYILKGSKDDHSPK